MSGCEEATLDGLTVVVDYTGTTVSAGGAINGHGYMVSVITAEDEILFSEMDVVMPYRGDREALCTALSFLVGYELPTLAPYLDTLVKLSEKYPT